MTVMKRIEKRIAKIVYSFFREGFCKFCRCGTTTEKDSSFSISIEETEDIDGVGVSVRACGGACGCAAPISNVLEMDFVSC